MPGELTIGDLYNELVDTGPKTIVVDGQVWLMSAPWGEVTLPVEGPVCTVEGELGLCGNPLTHVAAFACEHECPREAREVCGVHAALLAATCAICREGLVRPLLVLTFEEANRG